MEQCEVCLRLHNDKEPCPRRIARVLLNKEPSQTLTDVDLKWLESMNLDYMDLLEEALVDLM